MSDNIFQKVAGLAAKAFTKETPCPYETPIGEMAGTPAAPVTMRPQAIGSAEIYGDVPHLPPEFNA